MPTLALEDHSEIHIPLCEISANPLNPRKKKTKETDAELVESIKRHGLLQAIVVRPHPKRSCTTPYQLVFGERRWRCSKKANTETIRALVVELSDEACLEIMLVENGKREDLDPLEEAETYDRLRRDFSLSLGEISARVGKSKTTIHQRLKLVDLIPPLRKALEAGEIELSVAELIARSVHPSQQKEALERVGPNTFERSVSYRDAKRVVESEFMLRLVDAPWCASDETLDPKAGACAICSKRTANQRDLFPDVPAKDVCLDPECFARKQAAAKTRRLEAAAAEGAEILEGDAAKAVFDRFGAVKASSGFVDLRVAAPLAEPGKRPKSFAQVLGKTYRPPVTVVCVPESDVILELARKGDVEKALKAKGVKMRKGKVKTPGSSAETKRRHEAEFARAVYDEQVAAVVAKLEAARDLALPVDALRVIAKGVLESVWQEASDAATRRRGIEKAGHKASDDHALEPFIANGKSGELLGLIVELLAQRERPRAYRDKGAFLSGVAAPYRVNLKGVAEDAGRYVRALEVAKKASKSGKAPRKKAPKKAAKKKSPQR